ncbi:hypothetical protein F4780DRAFT_778158 [Xylariomycetidae sp. FL0641]|nr:hypothetical protein F4780DRAFT_778158 [Xylariomycetidae sp. FL0641]
MSGLEIVGVVLGAIPIITLAVEQYRIGVQTAKRLKRYERELVSLSRQLELQRATLTNSCERLLEGILPPDDIENLVANPAAAAWKSEDIRSRVHFRLDSNATVFLYTVQDMKETVNGVWRKLDLGPNGEVKSNDKHSILQRLKRASLVLKRSEYKELLDSIDRCNGKLSELLNHKLDVARVEVKYTAAQARFMALLRDVSRSVYSALRSSISCRCPGSHRANLELSKPKLIVEDENDKVIEQFHFRVVLSAGRGRPTEEWHDVIMRTADSPAQHTTPPDTLFNVAQPKPRKSVRFAGTQKWTASCSEPTLADLITGMRITPAGTDTVKPLSSTRTNPTGNVPEIVDLCRTLSKSGKLPASQCFGYVSDTSGSLRKFGIHPPEDIVDSNVGSVFSLQDVLGPRKRDFPRLWYSEKIRLAAILASSILQLYDTPWLSGPLRSSDVLFFRRGDVCAYERPYVAKRLPEPTITPSNTPLDGVGQLRPCVQSPTLLYLGILLLEIMMEDTFEHLRAAGDGAAVDRAAQATIPQMELDFESARRLSQQMPAFANQNYIGAVTCCVECRIMSRGDLSDDSFRKEVYARVVAPLEKDVQWDQNPPLALL